jgi:threonine dehydrogenase-like Zn-dependent dehydrogenase
MRGAVGFETADLSQDATLAEQIAAILGVPEVDCAIDASASRRVAMAMPVRSRRPRPPCSIR